MWSLSIISPVTSVWLAISCWHSVQGGRFTSKHKSPHSCAGIPRYNLFLKRNILSDWQLYWDTLRKDRHIYLSLLPHQIFSLVMVHSGYISNILSAIARASTCVFLLKHHYFFCILSKAWHLSYENFCQDTWLQKYLSPPNTAPPFSWHFPLPSGPDHSYFRADLHLHALLTLSHCYVGAFVMFQTIQALIIAEKQGTGTYTIVVIGRWIMTFKFGWFIKRHRHHQLNAMFRENARWSSDLFIVCFIC